MPRAKVDGKTADVKAARRVCTVYPPSAAWALMSSMVMGWGLAEIVDDHVHVARQGQSVGDGQAHIERGRTSGIRAKRSERRSRDCRGTHDLAFV